LGEEIATSATRPSLPRGRALARISALAAAALLATGLGACGDDAERQDASEPEGEFPVEVQAAKFPTEQRLAQTSDLRLELENAGDEQIPDLAVTINTGDGGASGPFSVRSDQPGLADPNRPVWILEHNYPKLITAGVSEKDLDSAPSAGAAAAQTNTFSFGPLDPGESKDIVWRVTPIEPGTYTVHYEIAAGLTGKAKAVTEDGGPVEGEFVVTITDKPPRARVNDAGDVVIEGD
jgi:hypothetical protein